MHNLLKTNKRSRFIADFWVVENSNLIFQRHWSSLNMIKKISKIKLLLNFEFLSEFFSETSDLYAVDRVFLSVQFKVHSFCFCKKGPLKFSFFSSFWLLLVLFRMTWMSLGHMTAQGLAVFEYSVTLLANVVSFQLSVSGTL